MGRNKRKKLIAKARASNERKFKVPEAVIRQNNEWYGKRKNHESVDVFHMVYASLVKSPSWRYLSGSARDIYIFMTAAYRIDIENEFHAYATVAYSQISKHLGYSSRTIRNALEELISFKFIRQDEMLPEDYNGDYKPRRKQGKPQNKYEFIDGWAKLNLKEAEEIKGKLKRAREQKKLSKQGE